MEGCIVLLAESSWPHFNSSNAHVWLQLVSAVSDVARLNSNLSFLCFLLWFAVDCFHREGKEILGAWHRRE